MANRKLAILLSITFCSAQLTECVALAEDMAVLEYEGITQISTTDVYPALDTSAVELVIEEVYIEAGSSIEKGGQILKLTDDSYQAALDYYEAAIIYAENNLTNTQMEYDQGMLDAQFTLELAQAEAELAENTRISHEKELVDAIEEHEEVMSEIVEVMEEVEYGISAGSYETVSSGSSSSNSNKSSSSSDKKKENESESNVIEEEESEKMSDGILEEKPEEMPDGEVPEDEVPEDEVLEVPDTTPETEPSTEDYDTQIAQKEAEEAELENQKNVLETKLKDENEKYNDILVAIYEKMEFDTSVVCGASSIEPIESVLVEAVMNSTQRATTTSGQSIMLEEAEMVEVKEGIEVVTQPETEAPVKTASDTETPGTEAPVTEAPGTEAPVTEAPGTETPVTEVPETETPVTEVPETAATEETLTEATEEETEQLVGGEEETENSESETDTNATETEDSEAAKETESENRESESETETEVPKTLEELVTELYGMESGRKELYGQLGELGAAIEQVESEIEELKAKKEDDSAQEDQSQSESDDTQGESDSMSGEGNQDESGSTPGEENRDESGGMSGGESQGEFTSTGMFPSGTSGNMSSGTSGNMSSGMSGSVSMSMGAVSGSGMSGMSFAGMQGNSEDTSLFGSTYDLTQIKSYMESTPSSTDDAEALLEQLLEGEETVTLQYEELIREREVTELGIQYTYDSAVIEGKMAEITYRQDTESLETTLQTAKDELEDLKEEKTILESYTDGIITAGTGGTVAAVNYEAEDILYSTALYSVYDMGVLTVPIEVSQYDIAKFAVGDSVEVTLSGVRSVDGTVTEKALEATSGASRTSVNYQVQVSIDNTSGWLSSGVSAVVTKNEKETENLE